jgi:hypothetical protein
MGEIRNPYRTLIGKPEGKRAFRKPMSRQEDNIKIDLNKM